MKLIQQFRIPYQKDPDLESLLASHLGIIKADIGSIRIIKRSLDARNKKQFFWEYSLEVYMKGENPLPFNENCPQFQWKEAPPLIIGAGPAGLFAAYTFIQHGIKPILFEQGERTHQRMRLISQYWRHGQLDERSNVCNGEGGAGTFSDGKLITRIKSPYIQQVMQAFVKYGAPEEITYTYNPHVGSNKIREVIRKMSDDLIAKGADFRFNTQVQALDLAKKQVQGVTLLNQETVKGTGLILACGHSAGKFFKNLRSQGVLFEPKPFALGLRIEHSQDYINKWQYGKSAPVDMEPAQYKLAHHWEHDNIGVYSFCMCPGGYVISSTTDLKSIVVNGMSNYHRNSAWANAAIVCSIPVEKVPGDDPFKMLHFQTAIERQVYEASDPNQNHRLIPAQEVADFLNRKKGHLSGQSSSPSGVTPANLPDLLPHWVYERLSTGLMQFEEKRRGFLNPKAILHAVESRTSSPVRIPRNSESMESLNTDGLFPCGEGPGYAGGITSAAVDGIKAALAWINKFKPKIK